MLLRAACIQTHHAPQMVDFYAKVFGYEPDVDGGVDFRFYKEQVTIFKLENEISPATTNAALIFTVEEVDAEYERLRALGLCNQGEPTDKPWGVRSFWIQDPDGNTVSFTKELSRG